MVFDLVVAWPKNCDYPIFRQMIRKNRHHFNEVIVVFTEATGFDYSPFVRDQMFADHTLFAEAVTTAGDDWRNAAMRQALIMSYNAPYVWFTEQDFEPQRGFFHYILAQSADAIGVFQGDRLHPCSLFMSRHALNQTHLDFSAKPPEYDHFGRIQRDLKVANIGVVKIPPHLYYHHNGYSHNWRLVSDGLLANYNRKLFYSRLQRALDSDIALHPMWRETAKKAISTALSELPEIMQE